jgi:hypothetical protein
MYRPGQLRSDAVGPSPSHLPVAAEPMGVLLVLRALASGRSALTGQEAIANAVPAVIGLII